MTLDPTGVYRQAQVATSSPVAQIVLLYEGAIRFTALSAARLEQHDLEGSHRASLRAQAIVTELRASLNLGAGDVAVRLDALYDFMIRRLIDGNTAKDSGPAREVVGLLRELLEAWRVIASPQAAAAQPALASASPASPGLASLYRTVSGAA